MTGRRLKKESKQVLIEILAGILIYMLAGVLVILFLPFPTLPILISFCLGCLISAGSIVHITYSTELTMDMHDTKAAEKYMTTRYLMRLAVWAVVLLIACFTACLNMLAVFIGGFGIKVGAYLQPFLRHFLECFADGNKTIRGGE